MAVQMGLEPTISSVTGRHVNHYTTGPIFNFKWSRWGELNPRISLGKAVFYHWTTSAWMAVQMGLEPTISSVTGRHVNHYTTGPINFLKIRWRRRRDLNSRASFPTYTLSRGTSSATWVLLQEYFQNTYFLEQPALSVTPIYNNMDKNLLQAIF